MNTFLTLYIEKLKIPHMYNTYLSILLQAWNYHLSLLLPPHFFIPFPEKYRPYICNSAFYHASYLSLLMHAFYVSRRFHDGNLWIWEHRVGYDVVLFSPDVQFSLLVFFPPYFFFPLRAALFIYFFYLLEFHMRVPLRKRISF